MPNPTEPREAENISVAQARAEGKIDVVLESVKNVIEKVTDLRGEVTEHRVAIGKLESKTQQLESDMIGAEEARALAAVAVKDADAARVAAAKAQVDNSDRKWSPLMRFAVVFGSLVTGMAAIIGIILALKSGSPGL